MEALAIPGNLDLFESQSQKQSLKNFFDPINKIESEMKKQLLKGFKRDLLSNEELKDAKNDQLKLIAFEAYCESSPQAILQTYTLWKKPFSCYKKDLYGIGKFEFFIIYIRSVSIFYHHTFEILLFFRAMF